MRFLFLVAIVFTVFTEAAVAQQPAAATQPELVIDQIKKTVVFISGRYIDVSGKEVTTGGTGFLVQVAEPQAGPDRFVCWLVTAKHVLRETLDGGPGPFLREVSIRFNSKQAASDGSYIVQPTVQVADDGGHLFWIVGSSDVDLAIVRLGLTKLDTLDIRTLAPDLFVTKDSLKTQAINENDEILFAGLFTSYSGTRKNYPVVRHGRLALLPEEAIPIHLSPDSEIKEDAYLADIMSFGGNSGSPVFVRMAPFREASSQPPRLTYSYMLLGVMQGYFNETEKLTIQVARREGTVNQNSGIAVIVPAEKITALLQSPLARAQSLWAAANTRAESGEYDQAVSQYEAVLSIFDQTLDKNHPQIADLLKQYAGALRKVGRAGEAKFVEQRADQIIQSHSKKH